MDESVKEIAATTGKAIDLAKDMGIFLGRFISGPLEQRMGIWEDKLKYRRWEAQISLISKANKKMEELGIVPNRSLPLKIAIPLLEYASVEETEDLQTLWANLLINYGNNASGVKQELVYIEILKSLSPLEAKILQTVYSLPFKEALHNGVPTKNLPEYATVFPENRSGEDEDISDPLPEIVAALANLDRLGCISITRSMGGGQLFYGLNATMLGRIFVESCTLKNAN